MPADAPCRHPDDFTLRQQRGSAGGDLAEILFFGSPAGGAMGAIGRHCRNGGTLNGGIAP